MPQYRNRFPNPGAAEICSWWNLLERCTTSVTAAYVIDWAGRFGAIELAAAAKEKLKLLRAKELK